MTETLRPKDYRFILICILICAGSLFVGLRYFHRAFPEASIDFRVNRQSSEILASDYLASQGISVSGYHHASSFRYDDQTKIYLERQMGLEKTNALVSSGVKLWRWGHRWFKAGQKEEVRAEITPKGEVASFLHVLPEDARGADLPANAARGIAESFLVLETKRPIDSLEFVDSQSEKRAHRTDHVFTWKLPAVELGTASYRVTVTVQGDRVDGYDEYVKVPEEWIRGYARLRSLNESTSLVDMLFFVLLGIGMLATLVRRVRTRDIKWRTALLFGAICAVLQLLASLNEFPLTEYGFDTASSYGSFMAETILIAVLNAIMLGGIIFVLTACVEPVYRQAFPAKLSISRIFSWHGIRTRNFFIASVAGITLTFFFFSYEIGFYLLANRFGAWAPAEIPYTDLLNTRFPWIFVLLGGFFPAVSEEWAFRAFSIPFLRNLLEHRWVAVILASFIWGFGHASYPNQPFFIRGLEVGIVGLILSWAMFRFGIVATLIAHYSIDAFYSAFLLLRSSNNYLVASGAITAGINLIPLLVAAGAYIATRKFAPEAPVLNEAEGTAAVPAEAVVEKTEAMPEYRPLSRRAIQVALAALLFGIVLVSLPTERFGKSLRYRQSAAQAEGAASRFLSNLKFGVSGYRAVTQPLSRIEPMAAQYVYTNGGIGALNSIYGDQIRPLSWQTRFFRQLQKEEFRVNVDPSSGRVVAFGHTLPEAAAGPDLPPARAQDIAASFLTSQGYDLTRFELKDTRSEKPRQRRDSFFIWEARDGTRGTVGRAHVRVEAGVQGNKVGVWTQFVQIPEEWRRARDNQNAYSLLVIGIRTLFLASMFALALQELIRATRKGIISWKLALTVALGAMILELIRAANSIPGVLFQYDTEFDMRIFVVTGVVGMAVLLIGIGLSAALASGLIMACYPNLPQLAHPGARRVWAKDAAVATAVTVAVFLALEGCSSQIGRYASRYALAPMLSIPDGLGSYLPILSHMRDILFSGLFFSAVLAFVVRLWTRTSNVRLRAVLAAGLLASLLPSSARRFSEAALDAILSVLLISFAYLVIRYYLRDNPLAYFVSTAVYTAVRIASAMLDQGNSSLVVQGFALCAAIAGGIAWLLFAAHKTATADGPAPPGIVP